MAGNFTGLKYDNAAYREEVARSTDPMLYRLDPNYAVNCGKCFAPYGPRNGHEVSDAIGQQIDVDSVLRGVSKISTKSNVQQIPDPINGYNLRNMPDCSLRLAPESSRFLTPAYEIRGLTTADLNFSYPLHDPQCQIFENFEVNTRLQAKDDHRAIWQVPFNQRDLLPTKRLGYVKDCEADMNCQYAAY